MRLRTVWLSLPFALCGCAAAHPTRAPGNDAPSLPAGESLPPGVRRALAQAERHARDGQLWVALRDLDDLPDSDPVRAARARLEADLGHTARAQDLVASLSQPNDALVAYVHSAQAAEERRQTLAPTTYPAPGVAEARAALEALQCAAARDLSARSAAAFRPNVEAFVVAAEAATCLGDGAGAARGWARAAAEAERQAPDLHWEIAPQFAKSLGDLEVRVSARERIVSHGSDCFTFELAGAKQTGPLRLVRMGKCPASTTEAPLKDADVREDDQGLYALRADGSLAWRIDEPGLRGSPTFLAPAFRDQDLLRVVPDPRGRRLLYAAVDIRTGSHTPWHKVLGNSLRHVIAAPTTPWAVLQTTSQAGDDKVLVHVVDRSGAVRTAREGEMDGCLPLFFQDPSQAIWSGTEVLANCPGGTGLLDVRTLRGRVLSGLEGFRAKNVHRNGARVVLSGFPGIALLDIGPEGAIRVDRPPELRRHHAQAAAWTPDGDRLFFAFRGGEAQGYGGIGRDGVAEWSEKERHLVATWWGQPENASSTTSALPPERDGVALVSCSALGWLHLDSGTVDTVPSPGEGCGSSAGATARELVVVHENAPPMLWRPGTPPRLANTKGLALSRWPKDAVLRTGGPWVELWGGTTDRGQETWHRALFDTSTERTILLPDHALIEAISPNGAFALVVREMDSVGTRRTYHLAGLGPNVTTLPLDESTRLETEAQPFFLTTRPAVVVVRNGAALTLDLTTQKAAPAKDIPMPPRAGARSSEGRLVLTEPGTIRYVDAAGGHELATAAAPKALMSSSREASFAAQDRVIVVRSPRGVWLYGAAHFEWLGRLDANPGGAFSFTTDPPDKDQTGRAPVELFGRAEGEPLLCRAGDTFYPWDLCASRFEVTGLLRSQLAKAARFVPCE